MMEILNEIKWSISPRRRDTFLILQFHKYFIDGMVISKILILYALSVHGTHIKHLNIVISINISSMKYKCNIQLSVDESGISKKIPSGWGIHSPSFCLKIRTCEHLAMGEENKSSIFIALSSKRFRWSVLPLIPISFVVDQSSEQVVCV